MRKNVSIAMATYNGQKYIKEQIDSILVNMIDGDELIISDDGSKDNTINIIKSYSKSDSRIKLFENKYEHGVKKNFENALLNCNNSIIYLSDQDDIWTDDKIEKTIKYFEKYNLIIHDCTVINENNNIIIDSFYKYRKSKSGIIKNIVKNSYIGCCMAFKKDLLEKILPIPNNIEMHDQWIGIKAEQNGKVLFIKDKLIKYRRHSNNTSELKHYPLIKMLKNRLVLIRELLKK